MNEDITLLTSKQTAQLLAVKVCTLRNLSRSGALIPLKIGKKNMYAVADIRAFVESCRSKGGEK